MIQNFAKKHSGFTLVELLVVIAIIGLLSTIVIVSFGAVRTQARDAAIRANLNQMRLALEMQFSATSNYQEAMTRPDFLAARNAIVAAGGSVVNEINATLYCINSNLPGGGSWCIDSAGNIGNAPASCNAVNRRCQ